MEIKTILQIGFIGLIVGSAYLLFITFNNSETVLTMAIAMFIIATSVGPIFATVPTLAMKSSNSRTGSTAAMLLTFQLMGGVIAAFSVGFFHDGTSRPMGVTIAVMLLFAIVMYFVMPNKKVIQEF